MSNTKNKTKTTKNTKKETVSKKKQSSKNIEKIKLEQLEEIKKADIDIIGNNKQEETRKQIVDNLLKKKMDTKSKKQDRLGLLLAISYAVISLIMIIIVFINGIKIDMNTLQEVNNLETVLNEYDSLYIKNENDGEYIGYNYYEKINDKIVFESNNYDIIVNIENGNTYTKNGENLMIDIGTNANPNEIAAITSITNFSDETVEETAKVKKGQIILITLFENESKTKHKRTYTFNKNTYLLEKIETMELDEKGNTTRTTISTLEYDKKITRERTAVLASTNPENKKDAIELYVYIDEGTEEENTKLIKASKKCNYLTITNWKEELVSYDLTTSKNNNEKTKNINLSKYNNKVTIYATK